MADVKAVAAVTLLFPEHATVTLLAALVLSVIWAVSHDSSMSDVDVPFLLPLALGLLSAFLLF